MYKKQDEKVAQRDAQLYSQHYTIFICTKYESSDRSVCILPSAGLLTEWIIDSESDTLRLKMATVCLSSSHYC